MTQPMKVAVLTVSDTRTRANDTSGDFLADALAEAGHSVCARDTLLKGCTIFGQRTSDLVNEKCSSQATRLWKVRKSNVIINNYDTDF